MTRRKQYATERVEKSRNQPYRQPKPTLGPKGAQMLSAGLSPGTSQKPGAKNPPLYHEGSAKGPPNRGVGGQGRHPTLLMSDELVPPHNVNVPGVNGQAIGRRRREREQKRLERELREERRDSGMETLA